MLTVRSEIGPYQNYQRFLHRSPEIAGWTKFFASGTKSQILRITDHLPAVNAELRIQNSEPSAEPERPQRGIFTTEEHWTGNRSRRSSGVQEGMQKDRSQESEISIPRKNNRATSLGPQRKTGALARCLQRSTSKVLHQELRLRLSSELQTPNSELRNPLARYDRLPFSFNVALSRRAARTRSSTG
jgi:hypothetical protein